MYYLSTWPCMKYLVMLKDFKSKCVNARMDAYQESKAKDKNEEIQMQCLNYSFQRKINELNI